MALDFADEVDEDIKLVESDKYRAYNLLKKSDFFVDNPAIGLDTAGMIQKGIDDLQIQDAVINYLTSFNCDLHGAEVESKKGVITMKFKFEGKYVHA